MRVDGMSRDRGNLTLHDSKEGNGRDELGAYDDVTFAWKDGEEEVIVETSFRTYPSDRGVVSQARRLSNTFFTARGEARHRIDVEQVVFSQSFPGSIGPHRSPRARPRGQCSQRSIEAVPCWTVSPITVFSRV